jgi:hypothetical protein
MLTAAVAILAGVVAVVMGRGGEITLFARDLPAARFRLRTPSDVAMLRLPTGLFGFQEHATREALHEIASMLADRDAEIARLLLDVRQLETRTTSGFASPERPGTAVEPVVHDDPGGAGKIAGTEGAAEAPGADGAAEAPGADGAAEIPGADGIADAGGFGGGWARAQT